MVVKALTSPSVLASVAPDLPKPLVSGRVRRSAQAPAALLTYKFPRATAELWCVSDFLEKLPQNAHYQSSTQRKAEQLTAQLAWPEER